MKGSLRTHCRRELVWTSALASDMLLQHVCMRGVWVCPSLHACLLIVVFPYVAPIPVTGGTFGNGIGDLNLVGLQCNGSEPDIASCPLMPDFFSSLCSHNNDAGVLCPRKY